MELEEKVLYSDQLLDSKDPFRSNQFRQSRYLNDKNKETNMMNKSLDNSSIFSAI